LEKVATFFKKIAWLQQITLITDIINITVGLKIG
jgi:hypothetical protein